MSATNAWGTDELRRIDGADELQISSRRNDGSLRPPATIWHTVVGGDLYIRSAHGPQNGWFRRASASGSGQIRAGGVTRDVTFEPAAAAIREPLDAALHRKYDRYGPGPVGAITGDDVLDTTLRVVPGQGAGS